MRQQHLQNTPFGLPARIFLYTIDQIAFMVNMDENMMRAKLVFFDGRMTGKPPVGRMLARNIAVQGSTPDWRVSELELKRWLRYKGYRVYDTTTIH